jgi:site-specific recombinase XerD
MRTRRPPMTPLRQRMVEDMQLRNFAAHTMRAYLHGVAAFAQHFHTSPEHLGPEHVRTYQLFLVQDKQRAWPTVVQTVCALRFFYTVTLRRPMMLEYIASPQRPLTLPIILSQAEVATLLTTPRNLKHRAILTTLYAAGLRVSALCQLQQLLENLSRKDVAPIRGSPYNPMAYDIVFIIFVVVYTEEAPYADASTPISRYCSAYVRDGAQGDQRGARLPSRPSRP